MEIDKYNLSEKEIEVIEEAISEQPFKKRKKSSIIWDHCDSGIDQKDGCVTATCRYWYALYFSCNFFSLN